MQTRPGFVLWFTGLPGSGKTTLAYAVQEKLQAQQIPTLVVDSDTFRPSLVPHPTYSPAEREWFYGVLAFLAAWLAGNGQNVLVSATANRRLYREHARAQIRHFAEVYVRCPPAVCAARDPKGIYALARGSRDNQVPGLGAPYEPPLAPAATVDSDLLTVPEAASEVLNQLAHWLAGRKG